VEVKYCKRCVMPNTRHGLIIDSEGICSSCRHTEYKKKVNWFSREKEFQKLCDKYRSKSDENDCIIAVSGGKDSFWQTYTLKEKYKMNPLLVSVWSLDWTKTGLQNFETMQSVFGCEAINLHSNLEVNRKLSRASLEHEGFPGWLYDRYIYTYPIWMSIKLNIPLVFYGENTSLEFGGPVKSDIPSALCQFNNDVSHEYDKSFWEKAGVKQRDVPFSKFPSSELLKNAKTNPQFMSYYFYWSGYQHMLLAKQHGWKSLNDTGEWNRTGWVDDFTQIDDVAYLIDGWIKYIKLATGPTTEFSSRLIRDGVMTREKAVKLVREQDAVLDPLILEHYLKFSGYSEREFFEVVDKLYNRNLFEKRGNKWKLKKEVS